MFALLLALAVAAAAFVKGSIGFGFPTVGTPLLTLIVEVKTAFLVLIIPNIVMDGFCGIGSSGVPEGALQGSGGGCLRMADYVVEYGGLMAPADRPKLTVHFGEYDWNDPVLVDNAELRKLWERVDTLTQAHRKPAPLPPGQEVLIERASGDSYLHLERARAVKGLADQVIWRVAALLEACDRLKVCPECSRIFVARRRQERHPHCARQARDRRRPSRQKKGT